jgi:hypothetical protein
VYRLTPARLTTPAKIAAAYWIAVLLVFFAMQRAGFDMIGDGAIPIAVLTAPWSLLAIAATSSLSSALSQALLRPFVSTVGTLLVFPVVCGGLNAILIFVLGSAIQRRRNRSR